MKQLLAFAEFVRKQYQGIIIGAVVLGLAAGAVDIRPWQGAANVLTGADLPDDPVHQPDHHAAPVRPGGCVSRWRFSAGLLLNFAFTCRSCAGGWRACW
ncbi:MAG: hypothetical protein MZW92_42490 [Comamonadaceae bacterium]|nr:hypothetical protein [Comamonadaceae bacterium]